MEVVELQLAQLDGAQLDHVPLPLPPVQLGEGNVVGLPLIVKLYFLEFRQTEQPLREFLQLEVKSELEVILHTLNIQGNFDAVVLTY